MTGDFKLKHSCGRTLGVFSPEDDHSGVNMRCPGCLKWVHISNGFMTELTENADQYDFPCINDEVSYSPIKVKKPR